MNELLFTFDGEPIAARTIREQAIGELIAWLPRNARTAEQVGKRALILAHLTATGNKRITQRQLAKLLGVSEGRASHAVKKIRARLLEFVSGRKQ